MSPQGPPGEGDKAGFKAFIDSLGLRYFKADELQREPPRELWQNGVGVLAVADAAREALGFPLRITSGYRDPVYNASRAVGGSVRSRHQLFEALDLQPTDYRSRWLPRSNNTFDAKLRLLHELLDEWRREGRIFPLAVPMHWVGMIDRKGNPLPAGICWRWKRAGVVHQPVGAFRFRGGLARYPTFVHVDTRGKNATWNAS